MGCLLPWLETQPTQKAMPPLLTAIHNRGQSNPGHQLTITQKYVGQLKSQRLYPQHLTLSQLQQQDLPQQT